MALTNGFTTYKSGSNASSVAKNNEWAAKQLQLSVGNPTAAQLNSSPTPSGAIAGATLGVTPGTSTASGGSNGGGSGKGSSGSSNVDLSALLAGLSGGGSGGGGFDYQSRINERIAALQNAFGASRGTIEDAYNRSLGNITQAYNDSYNLLQENNRSANEALLNSYNNSVKGVQDDAAQSLKEAYINRMMQQKNVAQQLSAMGLSGGASESTLAKMSNNYGNARNNINTTLNKNISNLSANRDASLAEILQNFNNSLMGLNQNRVNALNSAEQNRAGALANIEQALANGIANAYSDDFSLYGAMMQNAANYNNNVNLSQLALQQDVMKSVLGNALKRMDATELIQTMANNPVNLLSATQGSLADISQSTNYEYMQELIRALANQK